MVAFPICREGIELLKEFEKGPPRWRGTAKLTAGGAALVAYKCPAGVWTIGYGHTAGVSAKSTLRDERRAEALLAGDLVAFKSDVLAACTVKPNLYQLAALVCFAFNCGGWRTSTVIKAHNRGDVQAAARAFHLWVKARDARTGKLVQMPGLVSRRAAESALYLRAVRERDKTPQPQSVAAEPRTLTGDIGPAAITAGAGGIAGAAEVARNVGDLTYAAGPVLDLIKLAPLICCAIAGAGLVWWLWRRHRARLQGWL